MTQTMIILQGPSGGGKSTLAQALAQTQVNGRTPVIVSTDDVFVENGVYVFRKERLGTAHAVTQAKARELLEDGESLIIDNTNTHAWEARPYVEMAVARGVLVVFISVDGRYENVHGVPQSVVDRMRLKMEPLSVEACLAARYPWQDQTT